MKELPLRDYQVKLHRETIQSLKKGNKRVLVQSATGSGKTVSIMALLRSALMQQKKVLIIAHKIELISQLHRHCYKWLDVNAGIIANKKDYPRDFTIPVQVASIQTLARQDLFGLPKFDLIIIDECFTYDTLVDGKPISQYKVGDYVDSWDEKTGVIKKKRVTHVFKNPIKTAMVRIKVNDKIIKCTANHPFYTQRGWVDAVNLKLNDSLFTIADGNKKRIHGNLRCVQDRIYEAKLANAKTLLDVLTEQKVENIEVYQPTSIKESDSSNPANYVYNLEVEDYHTYFAEGLLVHNCHHSTAPSYARIFKFYEGKIFVGFTATPARTDGRGLNILADGIEGYQDMILGPTTSWLIDQGYLSDYKIFTIETPIDPPEGLVKITNGEYVQKDLIKYVKSTNIDSEIINAYRKHADGERMVVYAVDRTMAEYYTAMFIANDIPAATVTFKTPKDERKKIFEKFRAGEILILSQVEIVVEGVDIPDIKGVICCRPTRSLVIWFQAIGRSLRPAQGKDHAIVIDCTTNSDELPMPTSKVDWSLSARPVYGAYTHTCSNCFHVFRPMKHEREKLGGICPNCGEFFSLQLDDVRVLQELAKDIWHHKTEEEKQKQAFMFDLSDITTTDTFLYKVATTMIKAQEKGYQKGWVWHRLKQQVLDGKCIVPDQEELNMLCSVLGYKTGWANHKMNELLAELGVT